MLMAKLKGGATFGELAADYSEDPESAQRGGDLGFVPVSALQQAPPALRDAVFKSNPGTVQLVSQGGAHTIVLTVARDTKGQKDLSMPSVKEAITLDAQGPQGTVDPRRVSHQPPQRCEGRERAGEEGARNQGQDRRRHLQRPGAPARATDSLTAQTKSGRSGLARGNTPSRSPHSSIRLTAVSSSASV